MKYAGKYGEYRVLACLLEEDIEVYQAIKTNQPDFDLTAILSQNKVVRIQVKSTELNNKSTNNSIDRIDKVLFPMRANGTKLADNLHISRSKIFTLAVQDYLKKQENQSLLAQLNEAYEDFPIEQESW